MEQEPLCVLHIDPSRAYQRLLRIAFVESGIPHQLYVFSSVMRAVDRLRSAGVQPVDVVFLNVSLPMFELSEAVDALRALPALARARVVITTIDAYDRPKVPPGCVVVRKPFDVQQLRKLLSDDRHLRS